MAETAEMRLSWALSTKARPTKATVATRVPIRMKGVRLPRGERQRSDMAPKSGSRNSASTLSSAMISPDQVWDIPNLLVRIRGMVLS